MGRLKSFNDYKDKFKDMNLCVSTAIKESASQLTALVSDMATSQNDTKNGRRHNRKMRVRDMVRK